ncbi:dysbindin-A-like isoform X2 [Paramormyrops kingsleyae]|uniref:dysbindin-A-like isoform X2 n=1 Tax=Paramormyrops kingsleyae TaxID=1676925 RepID=UPI003B96B54E
MFGNFRERLQTVQQDFTTGIRTLSDKSKEVKRKKNQRSGENFTQFTAGLEILRRYEDTWVNLHKQGRECAKSGEIRKCCCVRMDRLTCWVADGEVVMLAAHWEKRRSTLGQLQEQLRQIPAFLAEMESVTTRIAQLEADFEEMDSHLVHLEDLCVQCEQQRRKQYHVLQLENYKKKKRKELEAFKAGQQVVTVAAAELDSEHAQKVLEMEHAQQVKLKERQKFFEEAFQQDMEQYLSAGYLQIAERRGSMSSMEVNVDILEQLELMDVSDQEALDVFLNSGAEDSSMTSPVLDSEPALLPTDLVLQVPAAADHCSKLSSMSSSCTEDSVSQETAGTEEASGEDVASPVVQSDEEEVQADTALVTLPESQALPNSDDSDSPAL